MTAKDILEWADRLAQKERKFQVAGFEFKVGRLTLLDSFLIDREYGRNPLLEVLDVQGQQAKVYDPYPYSIQLAIFWHGLRKFHPEISLEEAGLLFDLLDPEERARTIAWILTGSDGSSREIVFSKAGHPVFRIDFWLPLLSFLYGYKIRELLEMDVNELSLLIVGYQAVAKHYALLFSGKKSKVRLADPLVFLYPQQVKEAKND